MEIAVELSLYPLDANYIPPIADFIDRLNTHPRLRVETNSLSTQVVGEYDVVFDALRIECRRSFERNAKAVFVMKVLGPLDAP